MLWRLIALAALFGFLFGFDEGIIAGALPFIHGSFTITPAGEGFMTAAVPLGAVGGAMIAARWSDQLGRRRVLIACSSLFAVGSVLSGLATGLPMLTVSRLILGMAIGASAMAAPMFLAELAPARARGAIVSAFQLMITVGILMSYLTSLSLAPFENWRLMLALGIVPAIVTFLGIMRAPESPRWLVLHRRSGEARTVLASLQPGRTQDSVDREVAEIETSARAQLGDGSWGSFLSPGVKPIVMFTMMAFLLQQVSGINAVIYYAPAILQQAGFDSVEGQLMATVGIGLINMLVTVLAMWLVDRLGRRPLFVLGFAGTAACLATIALAVGTPALAWLSLAALLGYIAFFAVSLGPLPWLYMAELFPLTLRVRGMALASFANWSCNFLVVFLFPIVVAWAGIAATFWIFCGCCVFGVFFALRFAPETKGESLEALEQRLASPGVALAKT